MTITEFNKQYEIIGKVNDTLVMREIASLIRDMEDVREAWQVIQLARAKIEDLTRQ